MFRFLCNTLFRLSRIQPIRTQFLPNPSRKCYYQTNPTPSLIQYLQSSLGFSSERALALSRLLKGNPRNPDAVLTFFKSHGLSETQIKSIIDRNPPMICRVPESSLMPKMQFFKDKGISESCLVDLVVSNPRLFARSLEQHTKPLIDVLCSLLGSDETAVQLLIRSRLNLNPHILSTNLSILRNCGVQNHHISKLFMRRKMVLVAKSDRFNEVVETVKGMGFKPQSSLFVEAVFRIISLSRETWEAKFKIYKSLGWSAEEIHALFLKQPGCMKHSEEKLRKNFDYVTNELGWGRSCILIDPNLLSYSLEKRIIPRHRILQFLASKGLVKKDGTIPSRFKMGEKQFLKNFVMRYESEVPDILKIYEGLIGSKLLNIRDGKDCSAQ